MENSKHETRNSKQVRMSKLERSIAGPIRSSDFGFDSSFGFRVSDFRAGFRYRGFTLIELLVVIGIILLLIGILLPVAVKVQEAATVADQKAQIRRLSDGIEQYNLVHHAYPGPVSNADLYTGVKLDTSTTPPKLIVGSGADSITDSENLLLGLLGGLKYDTSLTPPAVAYDASILASQQGPFKLNPVATRGATQSFVNLKPDELSTIQPGAGPGSTIPEVVDRFGRNKPVMYFRASKGQDGVINDANTVAAQYNLVRNKVYTNASDGLKQVGSFGTMATAPKPAPALPYFVDQLNPGTSTSPNVRVKDGYILISAGPDEIYGTADDVCSFGSVFP